MVAAPTRRNMRWLFVLLVVPLLAGGWWMLRRPEPLLTLRTKRVIPQEWWVNFAVLSGCPAQQIRFVKGEDREVEWLDEDGGVRAGAHADALAHAVFSPDARVIASPVRDAATRVWQARLGWQTGAQSTIALPHSMGVLTGIADDGTVSLDERTVLDAGGNAVPLPTDGKLYQLAPTATDDPRLLPLLVLPAGTTAESSAVTFSLLDRAGGHPVVTLPRMAKAWPTVIFHAGDRLLCANNGMVKLFAGHKLLATLPGYWQWCGDGTLWQPNTANGDPVTQLAMLHWRTGTPHTTALPLPSATHSRGGNRFLGLPAAWGDGALMVRVEELPAAPDAAAPSAVALVLYRHGARAATYLLESPTRIFTTHLSFSPNGHRLYWDVQDQTHAWLYTFQVK